MQKMLVKSVKSALQVINAIISKTMRVLEEIYTEQIEY